VAFVMNEFTKEELIILRNTLKNQLLFLSTYGDTSNLYALLDKIEKMIEN
jgi:hypothetical protein